MKIQFFQNLTYRAEDRQKKELKTPILLGFSAPLTVLYLSWEFLLRMSFYLTLNADETGIVFYDIKSGEVVSAVSEPILVPNSETSSPIQSQKPHLEETETDADLVNNPVDGQISRNFGKREHPITKEIKEHNGIDIKAPEGTDVVSSISGTVTQVDFDSEKGNYIVVEYGNIKTMYAQLATTNVKKGQEVEAKQLIGTVGKTGNATGAHLHYEVMIDGEYVDPAAYIK